MSRMLGLRFICCSKEDWHYLIFYDIDKPQLTQSDKAFINQCMLEYNTSYILYSTKHGHHLIGLTPLTAMKWASVFTKLKYYFQSYYSGNVIRLSRKEGETQILLHKELEYGEIIPNLYNIFATRFNYEKMPWIKETSKYLLVFEKYRSEKE